MRVINRLDPDRYPPPDFIAAHAQTEWFQRVVYNADYAGTPTAADSRVADPAADEVGQSAPPVIFGPACAPKWIEERLRHLIRRTTPLLSDSALCDWMLELRWPEGERWPAGIRRNLRYAILLTRHLGRQEDLPGLLELDAQEFERRRTAHPFDSATQAHIDRKLRFHPHWSHQRFVRWLETADLD